MKKYNLLKVLAITVFVTWLLTLFIPGSSIDYTGNVTTSSIAGVGIWSLLSDLSISISYFNGIAVYIISIACFYAIVNKINAYDSFVSKVASIFENKKGLLVSITTIIFALLAFVVSDAMILIVFIPFIYNVMKKLEIDKKVVLASTIIASLIGSMCGLYNNTLFSLLSLELNTLLLVKIILLILSLAILIFFIAPKKDKKDKTKKVTKKSNVKEEKTEAVKKTVKVKEAKVNKTLYAILTLLLGGFGINKLYARKYKKAIVYLLFSWTFIPTILSIAEFITVLTEKKDKDGNISVNSLRRENVLFITSLVLFTLFAIFTVIPWESLISNFSAFSDFNTFLGNIKIGDYAIFSNIIGEPITTTSSSTSGVISAFGTWATTDMAIFLIILTSVIALFNEVKFDEFISNCTKGIKKVLPVAITAMLISIVLVISVTTGINITIANFILKLTNGFNIATATLASIIGSVLTGDFYYFVSTIGTVFTSNITNSNYYGVVALIMQSIFHLMMIIAPTSVGLIIGLYYLDIPYNKWFKFIWKAFVSILILIIITALVIYFLV